MIKKCGVLFLSILLASCSKYQKVLKSTDMEKKYEMAVKYYNNKDYFRSLPLLEELISVYRGTQKAEKVYYYYAYSHYGQGDYVMASYHFDNLAKMFPNGEYTEEAQFMSAYCYFLDSPHLSLDQTNTYKAIREMQLFINKYPESSRKDTCNKIMDRLRSKLETKSFNNARLYFEMGDYKAAISSLTNIMKDFPDSKFREESMFLIIKSHYLYAINSIDIKKEERFRSAIEAYNKFIDSFPKSEYIKEAESIFESSLKQLEKSKQPNL